MDISLLSDLFDKRREQREKKLKDFFNPQGGTRFLVLPRVVNGVFTSCSGIDEIFRRNCEYLETHLKLELCDDLPYLEPWIGVGVYATAFGSAYNWNTGGAPDTHCIYRSVEEIRKLPVPDWRKSPIMGMVLDTIDFMKDKTGGRIPICLTDTQSAQDTATLILDTTEFFTACYTEPELIHGFLRSINDLIIEFSGIQIDHIGEALWAKPGH
ncbi:MAG: hypothetical protein E4H36_15565, partial [Spirochaetales bacterium]